MTLPFLGWHVAGYTLLIGIATGLTYAILAVGLVLIYRATKVINFAHGEIGALGAAVLAKLVLDWHWSFFLALAAVVALGAGLGAGIELAVVRRLFKAPRLILLVATIGVSQLVFVGRLLMPDIKNPQPYPTPLHRQIKVGDFLLQSQHFMVFAVVPAAIAGLAIFLGRTPFGIAIRAAADNGDRAELVGVPIRRVSTAVWAIAGALAVLTVVLLNPIQASVVGLPSSALGPDLMLRALAAALIGGLVSLPRSLLGGLGIGMVEAVVGANSTTPGLSSALLLALVLVLVLRRTDLRDERGGSWSLTPKVKAVPEGLREVWWVRHLSRLIGGGAFLVAVVLPFVSSNAQTYLFTRVLLFAMIGLSATILCGWAGQLSLGQFAFVGVGALSATALVGHGMRFDLACGYAAVAGAGAALVVGAPALRVQGPFLAVTTLAFAVASQDWLYQLPVFGKDSIFLLPRSSAFGFLDLKDERAYYLMCLVLLALAVVGVSRLRASGIGRTIIAARDNPQAAASFTVSPSLAKLSAFTFSGALAGLAGALLAGALVQYQLTYPTAAAPFGPDQSMSLIAMVVIGGLGSVPGAVIGALYIVGLPAAFGNSFAVSLATSGIGLLLLLLYLPGGLMQLVYRGRDVLLVKAQARFGRPATATAGVAVAQLPGRTRDRDVGDDREATDGVAAVPALRVEGVSMSFGGTQALHDVSITADQGKVVGLIGSNGSGKSTLMNVVTGFLTPTAGRIEIGGTDVVGLPPHQRARLGVGRVFQDARLFGDLTLRETVKVALEAHERSEFVPSLLSLPPSRRAERVKSSEAGAYIDFLGLGRYSDHFLSDLSTGTRRIVEMCCLLAQGSKLLLLDEPTAGVAQRETEAFGPLIRRIQAELGATIVVIEHDIPLMMSISDYVYCLSAGEKIAEGLPDQVRNDPAVVAAYLGTDERAIARSGAAAAALEAPSLHEWSRADLLAHAAELRVSGRSRLSKGELIAAIRESR